MIQKRNEIKFILNNIGVDNFIYFLNTSYGFFYKEYPDRYINSIYFDNLNFDFYKKNIEGVSFRQKIRLRFYGKQELDVIEKPILEFKIKENNVGHKIRKNFDKFKINEIFSKKFENKFKQFTFNSFGYLKPVLINNYYRKYFVSQNNNVRFTIDQFIKYDYLSPKKNINFTKIINPKVIVEAKFSPEDKEEAETLINKMPLRAVKNSKYVIGINKYLK